MKKRTNDNESISRLVERHENAVVIGDFNAHAGAAQEHIASTIPPPEARIYLAVSRIRTTPWLIPEASSSSEWQTNKSLS